MFLYGLTPIQFTVYCYPSVKAIAQNHRCSESSVRAAVKRLEGLGLIHSRAHYQENKYGSVQQTSNTYEILPIPKYYQQGEAVYNETLPESQQRNPCGPQVMSIESE